MSLFFTLVQVKNCAGSNAITPTRLPAGSKMDLCWVTATWSPTATSKQEKTQIIKKPVSNCIVFLMPHKRIVRSPSDSGSISTFSLCVKCKIHTGGSGEGKEMGKAWLGYSFLALTAPCNETLCPFPLASFVILLILWQHQQIWHLQIKNLNQSRNISAPLLPSSFNLCNSCFLQDSWKPLPPQHWLVFSWGWTCVLLNQI